MKNFTQYTNTMDSDCALAHLLLALRVFPFLSILPTTSPGALSSPHLSNLLSTLLLNAQTEVRDSLFSHSHPFLAPSLLIACMLPGHLTLPDHFYQRPGGALLLNAIYKYL